MHRSSTLSARSSDIAEETVKRKQRWGVASVWAIVGLVSLWCVGAGIRWQWYVRSPLPGADMYHHAVADAETVVLDVEIDRPGIENPPLVDAQDKRVANSLNVIGVVVNGRAFAYSVKALSVPPDFRDFSELCAYAQRHVVNQLVGDTAVSVTYCDITKCVRVLTKDKQSRVLPLGVRGASHGKLVLAYANRPYVQDSPKIPLADHPFELTFWGDWVSRHPTSQIYLGEL
jgi:hypothetical protein